MQEERFREWLEQRQYKDEPLTQNGINQRMAKVRKVDSQLAALGFSQASLDNVHADGEWHTLRDKLNALKANPQSDSTAAKALVPNVANPMRQITNMISSIRQYGYFLDGKSPNYDAENDGDDDDGDYLLTAESIKNALAEHDASPEAFFKKYAFSKNYDYVLSCHGDDRHYPAKAIFLVAYSAIEGNEQITSSDKRNTFSDAVGGPIHTEFARHGYKVENKRQSMADRIREFIIAEYINPSREEGLTNVTIRAGDIHDKMGLSAAYPNVCQVIEGNSLRQMAGLDKPEIVEGPPSGRGANMVYRFNLSKFSGKRDASVTEATNTILYGPPGTGKTYSTALEAVKICDTNAVYSATPEGRAELIAKYNKFVEDGRIVFVTFHQNYGYEDFVEGLRPTTFDENGEAIGSGFRLAPEAGIFKRLCEKAVRSRPKSDAGPVRFILLWIGFNALYAADIGRAVEGQGQGIGERARYQGFFHAMTDMDREGRLYDSLWQRYSHEIRVLLDNRYVFNPFWQHHNGAPGYVNWQERFMAAKQAGAKALAARDGASLLSIIFDRLYVLRNQLVHGGATWNSDVNRAQVSDGAAILACLLPIFIDLMMDAPERDWDMPHYPVVED